MKNPFRKPTLTNDSLQRIRRLRQRELHDKFEASMTHSASTDPFPVMHAWHVPSIHHPGRSCGRCGALVPLGAQTLHEDWHRHLTDHIQEIDKAVAPLDSLRAPDPQKPKPDTGSFGRMYKLMTDESR